VARSGQVPLKARFCHGTFGFGLEASKVNLGVTRRSRFIHITFSLHRFVDSLPHATWSPLLRTSLTSCFFCAPLQPSMNHLGAALTRCPYMAKKAPASMGTLFTVMAETCPVLPKVHSSRNLTTMSNSQWERFHKECPFAVCSCIQHLRHISSNIPYPIFALERLRPLGNTHKPSAFLSLFARSLWCARTRTIPLQKLRMQPWSTFPLLR
jgi:hypothetical protein